MIPTNPVVAYSTITKRDKIRAIWIALLVIPPLLLLIAELSTPDGWVYVFVMVAYGAALIAFSTWQYGLFASVDDIVGESDPEPLPDFPEATARRIKRSP